MPIYTIQAADGTIYKIDATNQHQAEEAFQDFANSGSLMSSTAPAISADTGTEEPNSAQTDISEPALTAEQQSENHEQQVLQRYDDLPWYWKAAVAAGDTGVNIFNGAAGIATLGQYPKIMAEVGSRLGLGTYEGNLEGINRIRDDAMTRAGTAGIAAGLLGGGGIFGAAGKAGLTLARVPGLGKLGGLLADNAAYGAVDSAVNGETPLTGAAMGAGASLFGHAAGKTLVSGINSFKTAVRGPSNETLKRVSRDGYDRAAEAGLIFKPEAYSKVVDGISDLATQKGIGGSLADISDDLYKTSKPLINKLVAKKSVSPSLTDVEMAKRQAYAAGKGVSDDAGLAKQVSGHLRSMIDDAIPGDFQAGDIKKGITNIQTGRDYWKKHLKAKRLDEIMERTQDAVGANYTQAGELTALRQQMKSIRRERSFKQDWTPEEQTLIKALIRGKPGENLLRTLGKFSPQGPVSALPAAGLIMANPFIGVPATVGAMAARAAATKIGLNRFNDLQSLVRNGQLRPKITASQKGKIEGTIRTLVLGGTPRAHNKTQN